MKKTISERRLNAIKALAERGENGEQQNAKELLLKYSATETAHSIIITVREENMMPRYTPGDMLAIQRIDKEDITPGFAYYVVMRNDERYINVLTPNSNGKVLFSSENKSFIPHEVSIDKISEVYRIKMVLRIECEC